MWWGSQWLPGAEKSPDCQTQKEPRSCKLKNFFLFILPTTREFPKAWSLDEKHNHRQHFDLGPVRLRAENPATSLQASDLHNWTSCVILSHYFCGNLFHCNETNEYSLSWFYIFKLLAFNCLAMRCMLAPFVFLPQITQILWVGISLLMVVSHLELLPIMLLTIILCWSLCSHVHVCLLDTYTRW